MLFRSVDQSVVLRLSGDFSSALTAAQRALDVSIEANDPAAIGPAHRSLGLISLALGDAKTARLESELAVAAPDRFVPAADVAALTGLALAEAADGEIEASVEHGMAAVELCRQIGDRHLEGAVENHLADILHEAGREDESMVHLRRAVEAFAEIERDPAEFGPGIWMLSAS